MKHIFSLLLLSFLLPACYTPAYYVKNGNYDKAVDVYLENAWREGFKREKFVRTVEAAYTEALKQDRNVLDRLDTVGTKDKPVQVNAVYRRIQSREQRVSAAGPIKSNKGYTAKFEATPGIDSLEMESRRAAANYLYQKSRQLLAFSDSSGRPEPAREAYFTLKTITKDYFPEWSDTGSLIDSAYRAGKAYLLVECNTAAGVYDGKDFWNNLRIDSNFLKNEWAVCIQDTNRLQQADYRVKCKLVSLYVGSESTNTEEKTESKQVEDGYDEVKDTSGKVISRTTKYKTVTTTTYTYTSTRSANGTLLLEVIDLHDGKTIYSRSLPGYHSYSATSDLTMPSAPSYWGMISYVAEDLKWQIKRDLKKLLLPKPS